MQAINQESGKSLLKPQMSCALTQMALNVDDAGNDRLARPRQMMLRSELS
jgi:hypothetical protein